MKTLLPPAPLATLLALGALLTPLVSHAAPAPPTTAPSALRKAAAMPMARTANSPLPPLAYTQYRLPNGLRVIFHVDHSTPIVVTNLWYHVGSKNEVPGRTGFAHLFEHMMFQGSKNYNDEYFNALSSLGGNINATTAPDRTNFFNEVPSNYLERAIFLESDRMGGLLDVLTKAKLDNQRMVVQNEKRQSYDNQPYGGDAAIIASALYPKGHPYSWLTIGSMADLDAASVADVKNFFRRYYGPNNASLVIAGDFNPAQAKQWVAKYFGPIKPGPAVAKLKVAPVKLTAPKKIQRVENVQLARLYLTWPTVKQFAPGDAALDVLSQVLTGGKSSRLYQALVYKRQLAQDVSAYQYSRELAGDYSVVVTARPGVSLDTLERVVNEEIAKVAKTGPTQAEVARAYSTLEASFIYGMQGVNERADLINSYATLTGDPGYASKDLARYKAVTAADVKRVAAQYLGPNRVELRVLPSGKASGAPGKSDDAAVTGALPSAAQSVTTTDPASPDQSKNLPKGGIEPQLRLPKIQHAQLPNGLKVLLVERHTLPIVAMNLVVKNGSEADPKNLPGLAAFTAGLLEEGTKTRNSLQIEQAFDSLGAQFGASANFDSSNASVTTLSNRLPRTLDLFADVVLRPSFPQSELERQRLLLLTGLRAQKDDAGSIAGNIFPQLIFGKNNAYGHPATGTEQSVAKVTRANVANFYQTYWRPNNSTLIVVGDTTLAKLLPMLQNRFGGWKQGTIPSVASAAPVAATSTKVYLVDKPGAPQSVLMVGNLGFRRTDPDFFSTRVLNTALGGQFASRINLNLREDKGYTYGASSYFDARRTAGLFLASADVQTNATVPALKETIREIKDVQTTRPLTAAELAVSRDSLVRGYTGGFETVGDVASRLQLIPLYGLPDSYFTTYTGKIRGVTAAQAEQAAKKRLAPNALTVLIVGSAAKVEPGLREAGYTVVKLDTDGNPVK